MSGYGHHTHRVRAATFPFLRKVSPNPDLSITPDRRVLLGDHDAGQWWIAKDDGNLALKKVSVPDHTAFVRDFGGTLYAWGQFDHREAVLKTSTDAGKSWKTFDVDP
jgi:hypothetical protein